MDINSLYYFKELAQDLHMTKTANRLFISQQTLSNHIARLEAYCGTELFYRKPHLLLTDAGRHMLTYAKNVLAEEQRFKEVLSDVIDENQGLIRFGASALRSSTCLPQLLPEFSQRYPDVEIHLTDSTSGRLQQLLLEGELDLALSVYGESSPSLTAELLLRDQLYLCVSERLLEHYYGGQSEALQKQAYKGAHLADFDKLPYFVISAPNKLGQTIAACFEEAGYAPKIYLATSFTRMTPQVCSEALAACFITGMHLHSQRQNLAGDVHVFPLLYKEQPVYHDVFLVRHKNRYLTKYMLYFMELIKKFFKGINLDELETGSAHSAVKG